MKNLILGFAMLLVTVANGQDYQVNVSKILDKNGISEVYYASIGDTLTCTFYVFPLQIPKDTSTLVYVRISSGWLSKELFSKSWNYLYQNRKVKFVVPADIFSLVPPEADWSNAFTISSDKSRGVQIQVTRPTSVETPTTAPDKEFAFYSILGTNKTTCKFTDLPNGLWVCGGAKYLIEYR